MMMQDMLDPTQLAELYKAFKAEALDFVATGDDLLKEIEWLVGFTTGEHLWDAMWRFGIVLDDDTAQSSESLTGYWNPTGSIHNRAGYYVPCDYDIEIPTVSLDSPPTVDASWDSKGVAA